MSNGVGEAVRRGLAALAWLASAGVAASSLAAEDTGAGRERALGLLLGSAIGDALGGPVEFVPPERIEAEGGHWVRVWREGERMPTSRDGLVAYGGEIRLLPYAPWRPEPEAYAHWVPTAPPGTTTDDTRIKLILLDAIERSGTPVTEASLARAFVRVAEQRPADDPNAALAREWLAEYVLAARWVLGERDDAVARPVDRLWGGLGTCAGQMAMLPIACLHPGDPDAAYRHAYDAAFIDLGAARDINAGLVAGLAAALALSPDQYETPAATWAAVEGAMRETDPYRYGEVPWVPRHLTRWLDDARDLAERAAGEPARFMQLVEDEVYRETWWEAHVVVVMAVGAMELARHEPLAALRLAVELGADTDSVAQLVGAFIGAMHGVEVFPLPMRRAVNERLDAEHAMPAERWLVVLGSGEQPDAGLDSRPSE